MLTPVFLFVCLWKQTLIILGGVVAVSITLSWIKAKRERISLSRRSQK